MRRALLVWFVLSTLAATSAASFADVPATGYRVVVHPSNGASALDRRFVEDAFLKRIKTWPGGEPLRPVDLTPSSGARARFSQSVLRRSLTAVRAYWQQRIFAGRDVPPPTLPHDAQVIAYVSRHVGAIGYVDENTPLGGARIVVIK